MDLRIKLKNEERRLKFGMDFYELDISDKKGCDYISPDFLISKSKDLMIRGQDFYAVYNKMTGFWSTDIYDVATLVDAEMDEYAKSAYSGDRARSYSIQYMRKSKSRSWKEFITFIKSTGDNYHPLDNNILFKNSEVKKNDYATKTLPYDLAEGSTENWDKLVGTLYSPEEKQKIEWAIGSIVAGDSKKLDKFYVFYGNSGTGKSTVLNIIEKLFEGYCVPFEAKNLVGGDAFALEEFKTNPLVAIDHDSKLDKIEENVKLNLLVSHEPLVINEKHAKKYTMRPNAVLFLGTNNPVQMTDSKTGLKRRLIDIQPTGNLLPEREYNKCMKQITNFELGGIASKCLKVYKELGSSYYRHYIPVDMFYKTDLFFNFMEENYYMFSTQEVVTLKQAFELYKKFADENDLTRRLTKMVVRESLIDYFDEYIPDYHDKDGKHILHVYRGLKKDKFGRLVDKKKLNDKKEVVESGWIQLGEPHICILDEALKECPAQLCNTEGNPMFAWDRCKTKLKDVDSHSLHYVRPPLNHIVIDFDLKDSAGNKSLELNLAAANEFPKTYCEVSKGGEGLHLHYIYSGNPEELDSIYNENPDIEIKIFKGKSALRRKLSKCNDLEVATINSGLPIKKKEVKEMVSPKEVKNQQNLKELIVRQLNKETHGHTAPSVSFIKKILDDYYESGRSYDMTPLRPAIYAFALNSTHQSNECIKMVNEMHFKSDDCIDNHEEYLDKAKIVLFDIEVFKNYFLICYKQYGSDEVHALEDPTPEQIEILIQEKLVGFNNRKYDNHLVWAKMLGYDDMMCYKLSKRIMESDKEDKSCFFGTAYNLSFTDIYDYASTKQSLKKWEIQLGISHKENDIPWDKELTEEEKAAVKEYCINDVRATEAVFDATQDDYVARLILADLAGGIPNDTTNMLAAKLVFGDVKEPWHEFKYRNLSEPVGYDYVDEDMNDFLCENFPEMMAERHGEAGSVLPYFPGYKFENGVSTYRGIETGEGGLVMSIPGCYRGISFDVNSEHPHSIAAEYHLGKYTRRYFDLVKTRLALKHERLDIVEKMFDGRCMKWLANKSIKPKLVAKAIKLALNSPYGLTSAKFQNKFKDPRNVDNIVAKRGSLFMLDLVTAVEEAGYTVFHVKTDSLKVKDPDKWVADFIYMFGKRYGYTFEVEHDFEKVCLVNDAVYIGKLSENDPEDPGKWIATGAQFAVPYVFKTLFSHEPLEFSDFCETKNVTAGQIYIDCNEGLPDVTMWEMLKELRVKEKVKVGTVKFTKKQIELLEKFIDTSDEEIDKEIAKGHNYQFVGKVGSFCPVKDGCGGGTLYRKDANGKYYAVTGSKGYKWLEAEYVKTFDLTDKIDYTYYETLADEARKSIEKYSTTFIE